MHIRCPHCHQPIEAVDDLVDYGWKDHVILRDSPDLDPIRDDPRFQEILDHVPMPTLETTDSEL